MKSDNLFLNYVIFRKRKPDNARVLSGAISKHQKADNTQGTRLVQLDIIHMLKKIKMESVHLQIRITTDDEMNFKGLCDRAVVWGYAQEGSLEGFFPDPVDVH